MKFKMIVLTKKVAELACEECSYAKDIWANVDHKEPFVKINETLQNLENKFEEFVCSEFETFTMILTQEEREALKVTLEHFLELDIQVLKDLQKQGKDSSEVDEIFIECMNLELNVLEQLK